MNLEFPPKKDTDRFDDWMLSLWRVVITPTSGINQTNHAALGNLNSTIYTHLTASQATDLTGGGNSTQHYHSSDRDRQNHTGLQVASTIGDFSSAVKQVICVPLESQIYGGGA